VALGAILAATRPDELGAVASAGATAVRLPVRWADLQPTAGRWSSEAVEALASDLTAATTAGLAPWLALLGRRTPPWFEDDGGFADAKAAGRWWPRYIEGVAERVGDTVGGWLPIVAPSVLAAEAFAGRDETVVTAGRRALIVAWRDAWRILHGGPPVATALSLQPWDDEWPRALRTGEPLPNGLELDGLADSCDLLGGIVRIGDGATAEEPAELLVRLAAEGPDRPLAVLASLDADGEEERARAAEVLVEAIGLARGDGLDVPLVFAEGLLDAEGGVGTVASVLGALAH
jgi:hypothetical protein